MAGVEVLVAATPERVFAFLADPRNRPAWQSSLRAVADVVVPADDPTAAGVSWTDVTVVPGLRPRLRTTVSEPPHRWVEVGEWGPVRARLELVLGRADAGTLVRADFAVDAPGVGGLLTRAAAPAIGQDLRRVGVLLGHE